jgi:NADPH:quinone reductase
VDRIVEVDLAANMELDAKVCGVNGTISVYASDTDHKPVVPVWRLMNKSITLKFRAAV